MRFIIEADEEDLKEILNEKLNEIANFIFSKSQENLVRPNPKVSKHTISDTGFLLRSGEINLTNPNVKVIKYSAPYAEFVEWGSPPHYISPYTLVGWVRRKLRVGGKNVNRVCWAISRKIEREGIAPKPFLRTAIEEAKAYYK